MSYLSQFYHQLYGPEGGRRWVFVHGLMGYGQNWRKIISGLESTERCLSFDQRGHGRSFKPTAGYAPEDYAYDLHQIIEELGWDQIHLVGHSMGGRNVLNFASRFPEKVQKLVIEDIGPEEKPRAQEYYEGLLGLVPTPFATREEAKRFFAEDFVLRAKSYANPQVLGPYLYSNIEEKSTGVFDWRFSKPGILESVRLGRTGDRWGELKSLQMPTLLIRGERSTDLTADVYRKMLASNSLIKGVEILNAGHWVHSDQSEAFLGALKDFVGGF